MPEDEDIEAVDEEQTVQSTVTAAIGKMMNLLKSGDFKMTIGEFIRLIEFQKQLSADNISQVRISWEDPFDETDCVSKP